MTGKLKHTAIFDKANKSKSTYKVFRKITLTYNGNLKQRSPNSYSKSSVIMLITSPNYSRFCRIVPYIQCGLLSSPYFFTFTNVVDFITYPFTAQEVDLHIK